MAQCISKRAVRLNPKPDSQSMCRAPHHAGFRLGVPSGFYHWTTESGLDAQSTWCRDCLKTFILTNDSSDQHGQSSEADELARLELYEDRFLSYVIVGHDGEERDAIVEAKRLAGRGVV